MPIQQKIQWGFAVALAFLLLAGGCAWWSAQQNVQAIRSVDHTREVIHTLQDTLTGLLDGESGTRGFAISGNDGFLQAYNGALAAVEGSFGAAKRLTQDNPNQQRRLADLEFLIQQRISQLNKTIQLRRSGETASALQSIAVGQGKQTMDEIRQVIAAMDGEEEQLLRERSARAHALSRTTVGIAACGGLLALALVALAGVMVNRDLTRREEAEEERDRFFTLSLDMLCIANADGYFKRLNPAFTAALGWTVEEMLQRPFLELVHPEDRAATAREVERQVVRGQKVLQFENRYQHKDGSWRTLSWKSVPQPGGLMFATARDVTDLKLAQESLHKSEQNLANFKAALDEHAIVAVTDALGKITYVNEKFCTISKYSPEELIGQDHRLLKSDHHPKAFFLELWETVTNGRVWHGQVKNRAKDGSFHWLDTTIMPFLDGGGRPFQYITIRTDITQSKQAAERIELLNTSLRNRAAELESANQELESFSYSVSHDLRAPLRHVHGFVGLLLKETQGLTERGQRYLQIIASASAQMGQLIDDLLAFSKMGRASMSESRVSLDDLTQAVLRELEMATHGRKIVWQIAPLPEVIGDRPMLKQVLANLIGNAVKYTRGRDPAQIEIGCGGAEEERVVMFVRDNGAGFDMQYADKLFGVFQRLHAEDEFEGTGIGLAIVRRIVARHGGRTWAEGQLNKGATFYLTLRPATTA